MGDSRLQRKLGNGVVDLIQRLLQDNWRAQWRRWARAMVFMTIAAAATAGWAWIQKDLINSIFFEKKMDLLWPLIAAMIVLPIIRGLATYGQEVVLSRIGNRIVADMQRRVYKHVLSFGMDFFTGRPSSELIMKVNGGAQAARDILNTIVLTVGRDALTLFALLLVMVIQAPVLLIIVSVVTPLIVYSMVKIIQRVRKFAKMEYELVSRVIQILQETVLGARVIKTFDLNENLEGRMNEAVTAIEQRSNQIARLQASSSPLLEAISGVAIALITLYCAWRTLSGTGLPGEFVSFSVALLLAYEPMKRLARLRVNLETSIAGLRLVYGLLDRPASSTEVEGAPDLDFREGTIEFKNVFFQYRPVVFAVSDVSFKIERNTKVALVGPSGGGKSTILSLIPRLLEVRRGTILIDGQDIRKVSPRSLRKHLSVVSQDTYLFAGTVRDNIRLGRAGATDAEVEQAARDAFAHDFIAEMKKGYDTDIGENGVQLSGGQRQRIAIARAILKQAPILLLDEATSSLDSQAERVVQAALDRLMLNRTTLVIAHRLSTIINADRVLVIDQGKLVEQGTHRELLVKGGLYRELYEHQFRDLSREMLDTEPPIKAAV